MCRPTSSVSMLCVKKALKHVWRLVYRFIIKRANNVDNFDKLCELLIRDRTTSVSTESVSDSGWMSMRALTEAIDRYMAAQSANSKPKAFAVGQTHHRSSSDGSGSFNCPTKFPSSRVTTTAINSERNGRPNGASGSGSAGSVTSKFMQIIGLIPKFGLIREDYFYEWPTGSRTKDNLN